jgi:osmotically-inducible protein OsmY
LTPRARALLGGKRRRPQRLRKRSARELATVAAPALAAGVALEYFLDPRSGQRRRHVVRDRVTAALRRRARRLERQSRYEAGKVAGIAHKMTHREPARAELDDISLVRKVETELFRDRTIPKGSISINADDRIVVLRGQLDDAQEIQRIEREVRKVAGVRDVDNLLHLPDTPAPAGRPHGDPRAARRAG